MGRFAAAVSAGIALLVGGCATVTPSVSPVSADRSLTAPIADVDFAPFTKEMRPFAIYACSTTPCKVPINVVVKPSGRCKVDAPDIELKTPNVIVVWEVPAGFAFCPALGDGVFLKDSGDVADNQFDDMQVVPSSGSAPTHKGCHRKFRWLALNSTNAGKEYDYEIRFRNPASNVACVADPWVKNGR